MPSPIGGSISRERGRRARQIVDDSHQPLFVMDRSGNVLLSNSATPCAIGLSLDEFLASTVQDCVRNGYYDVSVAREAAQTRHAVSRILTTRLGLVFVASGTPIFDNRGQVKLAVMNALPVDQYDKKESRLTPAEMDDRQRRLQYLFGALADGDEIVAESPAMREVLQTADAAARSDSTVLITGETGTGKEVVARYIHSRSRRAARPFVPVNAAALPDTLLEAELFGYERGAFTGAKAEGHAGLFATAHGGTLFLDEVGDLPLVAQAKLLRVLDSGELRRVGSSSFSKVDVRVIAATHKNLVQMVRDNLFRADLFYRLNVVAIEVPAIRERPEDILPLAEKFRRDICRVNDCSIDIDPSTLNSFLEAPWPGNARELRACIERYIVKAQSQPGPSAVQDIDASKPECADIARLFASGAPLKDVLSRVEEDYIRHMLQLCGGRVGVTASRLGVYRTVLYRKLKAYREMRKRLS